ncbi:Phosphate-import protein PhnD precursor [Thiorhodovibrio winogradskyi]|uniref:Phosphate-import protein PhnD n=2 Tax=Thiorhodovibrio winogradskyi TaxID=77007 RepID=A0ABZ0SKJ9_9GAMM
MGTRSQGRRVFAACLLWQSVRALLLASLVSLPALAQGDLPQPRFRLGIVNERLDRPDHALELYGEMHRYLDGRLLAHGLDGAELVIAADLDSMQERVAAGEVDALLEGVMPTLAIIKRGNRLRPALVAWRKGQREYHSVFFVAQDSPIASLHDLAGKTLAFESPRSTSAYFVPRAALRAEGLSLMPADEAAEQAAGTASIMAESAALSAPVRFRFAGSELNQAYWVQRGRADAGAFNDGDWERVPDSLRKQLRIIHRTRPLLRWLLSFDQAYPSDKRAAVVEVLASMHLDTAGQAVLQQAARIARFEPLTAADRDSLAYWAGVLRQFD